MCKCPYCGAELVYSDWYFRGNYSSGNYEKLGDIFHCPNREGFEYIEEAKDYVNYAELKEGVDYDNLEELCCNSDNFNGTFYTDTQGNLHEGYPC